MAEYKKIGRARKLIVAGCLVERYRGDIRKDLPEVDALIGTNELDSIVAVCEGLPAASSNEPYLYHDLTPRVLSTRKISGGDGGSFAPASLDLSAAAGEVVGLELRAVEGTRGGHRATRQRQERKKFPDCPSQRARRRRA